MRALRILLVLGALLPLAGCLDFLDPAGLRLAKVTRIGVSLTLDDGVQRCTVVGTAPTPFPEAPGDEPTTLCVQATVFPGVDKFGALKPVTNDTLRVLGTPLLPEVQANGTLGYGYRFLLPSSALAETLLTVDFPVVDGVVLSPHGLRWRVVERVGPDTIVLQPGAGLVLALETPVEVGDPIPPRQNWTLDVSGEGTTTSLRGSGVPRPASVYPLETLANLGDATRYSADLRWIVQYTPFVSTAQTQVDVLLDQRIRWRIVPAVPVP